MLFGARDVWDTAVWIFNRTRAQIHLHRHQRVLELIHGALHLLRDNYVIILNSNDIDEIQYVFKSFFVSYLSHYRDIFVAHTGLDDWSASLKQRIADEADILVTTARDAITAPVRGRTDTTDRFHLDEQNTAFAITMKMQDYFVENDLHKLADRGSYRNERPDWRNRYRSASVMPIRRQIKGNIYELKGFLTIDSKQKGVFERDFTVAVGGAMADIVYPFIGVFEAKINSLVRGV